ncbi:hypothetical protein WA026_015128, partial [Henosepilachna vigintioctopunctata]
SRLYMVESQSKVDDSVRFRPEDAVWSIPLWVITKTPLKGALNSNLPLANEQETFFLNLVYLSCRIIWYRRDRCPNGIDAPFPKNLTSESRD